MATLTEITDQDSGVASSENTPESQNLSPTTMEEAVKVEVAEASSAEDKTDSTPMLVLPDSSTSIIKHEIDDDEEEDDDVDESILERIWGLSEMFPDRLRSSTVNAASSTVSLVKGMYNLSRQVVWIAVSSSAILFAPVMFELERLNVEEMMKQDRNRLVLGPGSAVSGAPSSGSGLMPPPPTR